jgi:hypothetical protein
LVSIMFSLSATSRNFRQLLDVRRGPDEHAPKAEVVDGALGLDHRSFRVLERHGPDAEEPRRVSRAVLGDPVVVCTLAVGDELDVMQRRDRVHGPEEHRQRRVQHRNVDAVAVHVGETSVRVVATGHPDALQQVVQLAGGHAH